MTMEVTSFGTLSLLLKYVIDYMLCLVRYMLQTINPNSSFTARLKKLLNDYPTVDIKAMGFPANWENESLWQ